MIPCSTNAPLHHWPIATVALMLLTALSYFAVPEQLLKSHASPPEPRRPPAFNPVAPPEQGDVEQAAPEAEWGADAFRIVEPPLQKDPAQGDTAQGGPTAGVAGQRPAGVEEGEQAAQQEPAAGRVRAQQRQPLTLALEHGLGLKPWQWGSSMFLHAGPIQLLLALLGLWAFGLIVEGKVGAWLLLAIYLGIGIVQAAVEQTSMLWALPSVSMGANAALMGLLGVAVVWAPRNEFNVCWGWGTRRGSSKIPVLMYGLIPLAMELIGVASGSFGMASSLLHLLGLPMGLAVGAVWLRRGWVDCEGGDLVSLWRAREPGTARPKNARRSKPKPADASAAAPALPVGQQRLREVERAIAEGNIPVALKLYAKLQVSHAELQLPQAALLGLIKALLAAKDFQRAIPLLREHIERFAQQRVPLQFNLAQLLLYLQQPRKGLEVLRSMPADQLDSAQRGTWQKLAQHAQHQIDEGTLEVSD